MNWDGYERVWDKLGSIPWGKLGMGWEELGWDGMDGNRMG